MTAPDERPSVERDGVEVQLEPGRSYTPEEVNQKIAEAKATQGAPDGWDTAHPPVADTIAPGSDVRSADGTVMTVVGIEPNGVLYCKWNMLRNGFFEPGEVELVAGPPALLLSQRETGSGDTGDEHTGREASALFGFMGWLTCRPHSVTLGAAHDAAIAAELVSAFIDSQGYGDVGPDYPHNLKPYPDDDVIGGDVNVKPYVAGERLLSIHPNDVGKIRELLSRLPSPERGIGTSIERLLPAVD